MSARENLSDSRREVADMPLALCRGEVSPKAARAAAKQLNVATRRANAQIKAHLAMARAIENAE